MSYYVLGKWQGMEAARGFPYLVYRYHVRRTRERTWCGKQGPFRFADRQPKAVCSKCLENMKRWGECRRRLRMALKRGKPVYLTTLARQARESLTMTRHVLEELIDNGEVRVSDSRGRLLFQGRSSTAGCAQT